MTKDRRAYYAAYMREYRKKYRDALLAKRRAHRAANREQHIERDRRYREAHKEQYLAYWRAYETRRKPRKPSRATREKKAAVGFIGPKLPRDVYRKLYRTLWAKERIREYNRQYFSKLKEQDPLKFKARKAVAFHLRRKRVRETSDHTVTILAVKRLLAAAITCPYCHVDLTLGTKQLDHIQPLALGGRHTISNIQVVCAACNNRKGAMPYEAWIALISSQKELYV